METDLKKRSPISRRRVTALCLLCFAILCGAFVVRVVSHSRSIAPPAIDFTDVDPEIAAAMESAVAEVRDKPKSGDCWGRLGMVLVAHQYYDEGNAAFAQAAALDAADARWPYLHGLTLLLSDSQAAVRELERAVERDGDRAQIRLLLAETQFLLGRGDEAEGHLRLVLKRDPDNARAHLAMARRAFDQGQWTPSQTHLKRCGFDPSAQKAAAYLLAEIHHRAGETAAAAKERERADRLPDDQPWPDPWRDEVERLRVGRQARLERVDHLFAAGHTREALSALEKLVRDHPASADVWLKYGRTLASIQELDAAEQALLKATQAAPQSIDAHFHLGALLFMRQRFE